MTDVVIVRVDQDRESARAAAEALAGDGCSVGCNDAPTGEAIGAAKAVIVLWSASAAMSRSVRAAADLAYGQGKLIQMAADGRMPPLPFKQLHYVSIEDWHGEPEHLGWAKVRQSVAALCGIGLVK